MAKRKVRKLTAKQKRSIKISNGLKRYHSEIRGLREKLTGDSKKAKQNRQLISKRVYKRLNKNNTAPSDKTIRVIYRKYQKIKHAHAVKVRNKVIKEIKENKRAKTKRDDLPNRAPTVADIESGMKGLNDKLEQDQLGYSDDT